MKPQKKKNTKKNTSEIASPAKTIPLAYLLFALGAKARQEQFYEYFALELSPGKLRDCRGFVALKLASRSASVQKFFWEVPDLCPTVAVLCTKHAWLSGSLNKL